MPIPQQVCSPHVGAFLLVFVLARASGGAAVTWVVTKIEMDSSTAQFGRSTLWANRILYEPPRFPGAVATRAFYLPENVLPLARQLYVGDEVEIETRPGGGLIIESMVGLRLLRTGPVDWRG
jgi:hypothetical protein